jgi:hypothetical protein
MIKSLSSGYGITVTNNSSSYPYISNAGNPGAGMVRYNGSNQNLEVNDGNNWLTITGSWPSIELNSEVQSLLEWAKIKRDEDLELKSLAEKYPAVKDVKEQLDVLVALVRNSNKETKK